MGPRPQGEAALTGAERQVRLSPAGLASPRIRHPGAGMTSASKPVVDLWITQAGYPQLHRRHISQNSKGILICFDAASGLSTAPQATAWHACGPAVLSRGMAQLRPRTKRTDHELHKPDRLTS